jgi:predicted dehydrogenase
MAKEFAIKKPYADLEAMLDEARLDAVVIAVSHDATVGVAEQVLSRGIPCLIEKPAGYSSEETRRLARLATESNSLNMVGLNRRFMSVIQDALTAVLARGPLLGFLIEAHEPIDRRRAEQSLPTSVYDHWFVANTIHAVDLIRMVGGEVQDLKGFCSNRYETKGDSFSFSMRMPMGLLGSFVSHWNSPGGFSLQLFGDGISATLSPLERGILRFDTGRELPLRPVWCDTELKPGLYLQATCFLNAVCQRYGPAFPASDLADNVLTMELMESMLAQVAPPIAAH